MFEVRTAKEHDIPMEKVLWAQVFDDEEAFIQTYYDTCYSDGDILIALEDGQLVSMLLCLPVALTLPGDGYSHSFATARGSYFYALATSAQARGKGYAHKLLSFAHSHLREAGQRFSVTVPAMDSLFPFFQSAGMRPFFSYGERRLERAALPLAQGIATACTAEEYHLFRQSFSFGQPSIAYPREQILWQKLSSEYYHADLFKLTIDGQTGYAAAEYMQDDVLTVKELLFPAGPVYTDRALAAIAQILPAKTYVARTPVDAEKEYDSVHRFGSIAWYDPALARMAETAEHGYLGLAFD